MFALDATASREPTWHTARTMHRALFEAASDETGFAIQLCYFRGLSDFQVTIPELGTIKVLETPIVIMTSNRTREVHDALERRCLYHWLDYPDPERD